MLTGVYLTKIWPGRVKSVAVLAILSAEAIVVVKRGGIEQLSVGDLIIVGINH